jgi:hypothetical protein
MSKMSSVLIAWCLAILVLACPAYATEVTGSGGWAYEQIGQGKYQLVIIRGQGGASAAAPSYSEGQAAGMSFDLSGNLRTTAGTAQACERLIGVAGKDYCNTLTEAKVSIISKTTAVTIGAGAANDTFLLGILTTQALAGTCVITGFADSDGTAQSYTLPAATPAGFKSFIGAKNSAGALTVTCSNAGDDNVPMIFWVPAS